jgi:predicted transcriptional regulator
MLEKQHIQGTLSRRERQIMDVLYRHGKVSAAEVQAQMPNPPGYSAVRAMLRILEDKGHIRHIADGLKYLYLPTVPREKAKRSAIRHGLDTFFNDSPEQVMAALLDVSATRLNRAELERMSSMIEKAKQEGK